MCLEISKERKYVLYLQKIFFFVQYIILFLN